MIVVQITFSDKSIILLLNSQVLFTSVYFKPHNIFGLFVLLVGVFWVPPEELEDDIAQYKCI